MSPIGRHTSGSSSDRRALDDKAIIANCSTLDPDKNSGDAGDAMGAYTSVIPSPKATRSMVKTVSGWEEPGPRSSRCMDDRVDGNGNIDGREDGDAVGAGAGVVYRVYKRRWFGLVQLSLLNIMVSWDWLTFSPVSHHAAAYFDVTESSVNWLSTAFLFSFVAVAPLTIYVLHWGAKPSISCASALLLLGNWVRYAGCHSGGGGNFGLTMLGQILSGFAQAFMLSTPTRYSDLWFTSRARVTATAVMSLCNPLGGALGQLIVPFMVARSSDISNAVLYVSIISTLVALPSFFIPGKPPTAPAPSSETEKASLGQSVRMLATSLEFWLVFIPFGLYVALFNSISSLLNQIMMPYGFSSDDAGIAGALLIVVGLVTSAMTSPVIDRTQKFVPAIKLAVPIIGLMYLLFLWMPMTRNLAGPYVVLSLLGAASFSLVPIVLEYMIEITHPCSPELTSTLAWSMGQLLGGCFILISDALKAGPAADPPHNMIKALIFQAVIALAVVPLPLALGLFGRQEKIALRRILSDDQARGLGAVI